MSWSPHVCHHCHHPVTLFHAALAFGPPFACAIVWICTSCDARNVELCAIGPDNPKPGDCLECGVPLQADGRCEECENLHADLVARIHAHCGSPPKIEAIRALREQGLYRVAFNAVHLLLQADPNDTEALVTKAKLLTEVHRPAQAIPLLRRVLADESEPGPDPNVFVDLGVALANSGQNHAAIEVYERFLADHPSHEARGVVLSNIGACYSALGQVAQGEAYHRRAIAADPERLGSRWNLFANLCKAQRYADAITVIDDTIELPFLEASERENLHAYRGQLFMLLERFDEALDALDRSLASEPTQPDRQFTRAQVLVRLGRFDQARVALHHVLARYPESGPAKRLLAQISERERSDTN